MNVQHQKRVPSTIPKNPIDDHKTCTIREKKTRQTNTIILFFIYCHCKETHTYTFSYEGVLMSPSGTAILYTIHNIFILAHPIIDKSKLVTHRRPNSSGHRTMSGEKSS